MYKEWAQKSSRKKHKRTQATKVFTPLENNGFVLQPLFPLLSQGDQISWNYFQTTNNEKEAEKIKKNKKNKKSDSFATSNQTNSKREDSSREKERIKSESQNNRIFFVWNEQITNNVSVYSYKKIAIVLE